MPKVRVAGFGVSLDGFGAGTEQSLSDPLGKRGPEIFQWFFHTKTFCAMHGQEGGSMDVDDEFARRAMENFGAFILGRNMFGPVRGPWPDSSWKGWWDDLPLCHWRNRRRADAGETGGGRQGCQNRGRCFHGAAISASRTDRFP